MTLHIAQHLELPLELCTESIGLYAVKGAGKTYAGSVLAEEMMDAGVQVAVIDPTDQWWGLRSSADGKQDGYAIYVFGGAHADVPLEADAGELVADVIVDTGINAILSLRHLSKGNQHKFVTAFCERLYFRKGEPDKRTPLHLFIDEAHSFAPQSVTGETARMVGAVQDIVRLGRGCGLGCSLISQRPASVNNDVRSMTETLVVLRMLAPHDRKAIKSWFDANDPDGSGVAQFMGTSASLGKGEAWVWAPGIDVFQRVQIRQRRTFDSSATPKIGETVVTPRRLTPVDVAALGQRIQESVERAAATDPRKLQARVRELERQLAAAGAKEADPELLAGMRADAEGLREDVRRREALLQQLNAELRLAYQGATAIAESAVVLQARLEAAFTAGAQRSLGDVDAEILSKMPPKVAQLVEAGRARVVPKARPAAPSPPLRPARGAVSDAPLKAGARRMLAMLAAFPDGLTLKQLSTLAGVAKGGTFSQYLASLKNAGLVDLFGNSVVATADGFASAEQVPPVSSQDELVALYGRKLKAGARRMLDLLIAEHPRGLTPSALSERAEVAKGGTFSQYLGSLRSNGLIEEADGVVFAGSVLFMFERKAAS